MDMDGRGHGGGEGGEAQTYRLEFPKGGTTECPVEGCPGRAGTRTAMRLHVWRRHVRDTIIILEEGNLPHPRCKNCNMFVPWRALNSLNKSTMMCKRGGGKEAPASGGGGDKGEHGDGLRGLQAADQVVPRFTCLGKVMTAGDDD